MTMAITSFAYGEIYNIHDGNDKINFKFTKEADESGLAPIIRSGYNKKYKIQIQHGTYKNTFSIAKEIVSAINTKCIALGNNRRVISINPIYVAVGRSFSLTTENIIIHIEDQKDQVWSLLGISNNMKESSIVIQKLKI